MTGAATPWAVAISADHGIVVLDIMLPDFPWIQTVHGKGYQFIRES